MDTLDTTSTHNTDELAATVTSMVRGTDNNGNYMFEAYSPKAPITPPQGHRVSKVMYKTNTKTNTVGGENSCLIVPVITESIVQANIERLTKHVVNMLESEQDKIVKAYHLDKVTFVEPEKIGIDAIIEALEAVAVSGRINKEMIGAWFSEHCEDNLTLLIADKLGCDVDRKTDTTSKLYLMLKTYKDLFAKMASNTTQYQPAQAEQLLQALTIACDSDDSKADMITIKLSEKLTKMMNPVDTMELLGF